MFYKGIWKFKVIIRIKRIRIMRYESRVDIIKGFFSEIIFCIKWFFVFSERVGRKIRKFGKRM